MKHGHALVIGTLGLALAACGGHGHHDGTSTTTTSTSDPVTVSTAAYVVEAVLSDPQVDPGYLYQDPLDLQILDRVTFQLVSYSGSGSSLTRTVVATSSSGSGTGGASFATSDSLGRTGGLSTTDGSFSVSGTDSGNTRYRITASYLGKSYTALYQINPRLNEARIRGAVVVATGSTVPITKTDADGAVIATANSPVYQGVHNAEIDFYEQRQPTDSSSRQIVAQRVFTAEDGTFRASVPIPTDGDGNPVPIRFVVIPPNGYSTSFTYAGVLTTPPTTLTDSDVSALPLISTTLEVDPNNVVNSVSLTEGPGYLVLGTDLTHDSETSFHINSVDHLDANTNGLIQLTTIATKQARKASTKAR